MAVTASALRLEFPADRVARLIFDQPGSKANTLGEAVLADFEAALLGLERRTDLEGLILESGKPGMFIAGADLKELAIPRDEATTRRLVQRGLDIIARFERLAYPTVALIDGACMGGGTEVALGFDYRLAGSHPKTEIGLPEVKVGLIPGWGGTQRMSRIIGPALAAELICAGDSVKPPRARDLGLAFDAVPSDKLVAEALRLLAALTAIAKGCNLPLEEGLKVENEQFVPLVGSLISRNLIAVFFMNQRLAKDPGVADASIQPRPLERVGVVGAGIMGSGIAGAHVRRGVPTLMLDVSDAVLEKSRAAIAKVIQARIDIGRATPQEMLQAFSLLTASPNLALCSDRDLVVEAVVENEEVKTKLYRALQAVLPDSAILASNTSTISITRMAKAWTRSESFAGLHFFNPVDRMQLVEVIRGEKTSDQTVATLVAHAKRIGKSPIVVRDCPGFLVNRILFPYMNEALALLEEGAEPRAIDKSATDFGMPMGPITLSDVVGLDTALYAGQVVNRAFADRAKNTRILDELVQAGRLGQKSGAGFYSYAKGSRGADDPAFAAILQRVRDGTARSITQEEITERLFLPMLVEASLVLTEGIVREPSDVDLGLILGLGFPAWRGGLLRWADSERLAKIEQSLAKYAALGKRFQPTKQMRDLARQGKGFYG
jgi:3-hydroxyacyl-CoA dehydrogenase/enoyl-CoA hydratase/3-hydroxybutyryl-CoA epimerase/enoyl-CoA isomerase